MLRIRKRKPPTIQLRATTFKDENTDTSNSNSNNNTGVDEREEDGNGKCEDNKRVDDDAAGITTRARCTRFVRMNVFVKV